MNYVIRFVGHITREGQLEGLPPFIYGFCMLANVENKQILVQAIDREAMTFVQMQGMAVSCDPGAVVDPAKVDTNRMFVPMHMISRIRAEVKPVTGPLPQADELGKEMNPDGTEPKVQ